MARIRSIKPEFFTSEQVVECSPSARLLFVGMWCFCDDNGVHPASYARLKMEIMPGDTIGQDEIAKLVDELERAGLIHEYEVNGKPYWLVTGWKHQKIDRPSFKYPLPVSHVEHADYSSNSRLPLDESSSNARRAPPPGGDVDVDVEKEKISASPGGDAPTSVPIKAIISAYNRTMDKLPKVREITPKRRSQVRTAWAASAQRRSMEFWEAYFEECAADDFLNGTGPYRNGHENWLPSFDYLMRADVVTKVFEKAMHRIERAKAGTRA